MRHTNGFNMTPVLSLLLVLPVLSVFSSDPEDSVYAGEWEGPNY